jgi:hypothetical protein
MDVKEIATMRGIGEKTVAKAYENKLDILSILILVCFFSCSLNQAAQAQNVQKLIEQFGNTSFLCTSSDIPAGDMAKACEEREGIWDELSELGYSYGCGAESEGDKYWRNDCATGRDLLSNVDESSSAVQTKSEELSFSCEGTAQLAIRALEQTNLGIAKFRKIGVATLDGDGNVLSCQLISAVELAGMAAGNQSSVYTATLLDDNTTVWVEFPRLANQPVGRGLNWSSSSSVVKTVPQVYIPVRTYVHRAQDYVNFPSQ